MRPKIGLVTYDDIPGLTVDDGLLADALRSAGMTADPVIWSDRDVDWGSYTMLLMRSTWDYFHRIEEFRHWLERIEPVTRVVNSVSTIRWNMEKTYLREIEAAGVPIIPALFVFKDEPVDVVAASRDRGWSEVVIKPTISGSAFGARRFDLGQESEAARQHAGALIAKRNVMIQPFMREVETERERALVFLDGRFSHSVRKAAFYTKTVPLPEAELRHTATPAEIEFGERALFATKRELAYARVDIVPVDSGFLLMELELIEPALFFGRSPEGLRRFVERIVQLAAS